MPPVDWQGGRLARTPVQNATTLPVQPPGHFRLELTQATWAPLQAALQTGAADVARDAEREARKHIFLGVRDLMGAPTRFRALLHTAGQDAEAGPAWCGSARSATTLPGHCA